jgi:succinate dehydrogenase/fumarate reductase-like Fe-S protein
MSEPQRKKLVITRFDPDVDEVPKTQEYEIPVRPDWKVLDALNFIKDEIDGTLSHRWSCRMAVCGSCGMMVDGEPTATPSKWPRSPTSPSFAISSSSSRASWTSSRA